MLMVEFTKANTSMIKNTVKEHSPGLMEGSTKEVG